MSSYLLTAPELHEELGDNVSPPPPDMPPTPPDMSPPPPDMSPPPPDICLFDVRWRLTDPSGGRVSYLEGHVPGAVFVDLDRDLSDPAAGRGRHPLPSVEAFAQTLGRLGVGPRSDVVAYDDVGGGVASRMWWMLRSIGHRGSVRLLDGGWAAWSESGYAAATDDVIPAATHYPVPPHGFRGVVDVEGVETTTTHLLFDARSPDRYRGIAEPVDPRAGHIPGAVNVPWQSTLAPDRTLRDPAALRRQFVDLGADRRPVIVSCGSGVTSCQLALALEVAGLPRPLLYPGSFSEWATSDREVAEGSSPG